MLTKKLMIPTLFVSSVMMLGTAWGSTTGESLNQSEKHGQGGGFAAGAVFVMTNNEDGNNIAMYRRFSNGRIRYTGRVSTGGTGSFTQVIDPLGSQGSLIMSEDKKYLLAANAGSNEISVFAINGHRLRLVDKVHSNGFHPNSITINDDIVYVLNQGGNGTIAGFRLSDDGQLSEIPGTVRDLNINGTLPPQINDVNHQVLFHPDGDKLVVTTGLNTNMIQVFSVDADGVVSETSVDTPSNGINPFSVLFSRFGDLIVAEGEGTNGLSSYDLKDDNTLVSISASVVNGKSFSCWLVSNGNKFLYLINTGTEDISVYETSRDGHITLVDTATVTLPTAFQTDSAFSADGNFMYTVNGGTGTVGVMSVNNETGDLEVIQDAGGLEDRALLGLQGIVAY